MSKGQKGLEEQSDYLIDVRPENIKKISLEAKRYKAAQARKTKAAEEEAVGKHKILQLVKEADLQPLADGKIRFKADGMLITITPREDAITVKEGEADTGE